MRLQNKRVIVTAAASGMGRAGVELFLREGAIVAAVDVNQAGLDALAADMTRAGHHVHTIVADLSRPEEMRSSINDAAAALGGVDVLWAHAGIPGPGYREPRRRGIRSGDGAQCDLGRARGGGGDRPFAQVGRRLDHLHLVHLRSHRLDDEPVYSAAKFTVVGLAKSLFQTFAPDNVRVNVVCPGLADTPMKLGFTGRSGDPKEAEANQAKLLAAVPMGRLCKAEEVAHAVLWLASDDASFVTGVALPVDGGFTAR